MPLPHPGIGLGQMARRAQQQCHGVVRDRHCVGAGAVGHHDPARGGGGQIDVLVAHAQRADHFQPGQRGHFIGAKAGGAAREHDADLIGVVSDGLGPGFGGRGKDCAKAVVLDNGQIVLNAVDQDQ
ncbi:hypothetical protein D3C85_1345830 [compost metagenome]